MFETVTKERYFVLDIDENKKFKEYFNELKQKCEE